MSTKKVIKKVAAAVVAIVYGAGEIPEVWLGMEEVLKAYGEISDEEAQKIGLVVALTVGLVAAVQGGTLVFYHVTAQTFSHARDKLQRHMHAAAEQGHSPGHAHSHGADAHSSCDEHEDEHDHAHSHDHSHNHEHSHEGDDGDHSDHVHPAAPTCSQSTRKILAYTVMSLGMLAQFGLSAAAWDQVLNHVSPDASLGWHIGVPVILGGSRAIASGFFQGHHTISHIAAPHQHVTTQNQNNNNNISRARVVSFLVGFLYLALWTGHAGQANFEIVETREYGLHLANDTNALNQTEHPAAYWGVRSFELLIAAVLGLQMAFVEGHHIRELKGTLKKFSQVSLKEKLVSAGSAVVGAVAHTLPEVAGLMMIASEWQLGFGGMVGLVAFLGTLELFIAGALHLPYNMKVAKWCCQSKDDYEDVSSDDEDSQDSADARQMVKLDPSNFTAASKEVPTYQTMAPGY